MPRSMLEILKAVDGLAVAPVSEGAFRQNKILGEELPFRVFEYASGSEHNGWIVPQKWEVKKAEIRHLGKLVYDGKKHPLGVAGYSASFRGKVSLSELKQHLFYNQSAPGNIVYHCDFYYKPHRATWGFSVPYDLYRSLPEGEYEVDLETVYEGSVMQVLEYTHKGTGDDMIILNAHNCHAAQLNDGPSGYAVGIEVMRRLQGRKTRYTYKLLIAPEHFGTVFYTAGLSPEILRSYKYCIFLEMLGNVWPHFALQETFGGVTELDQAASNFLKFYDPGFYQGKFRTIVGNDETVWESPGIEIPTISLSRCESSDAAYPEYHLDSDNLSVIRGESLDKAAEAVSGMIDVLESNCRIQRKFSGLVALSNPKYDLYVSTSDPSINIVIPEEQKRWNYLMDCLPRYFDGNHSVLDIAVKHELPFAKLYGYLLRFKEKGLVEFIY